MAAKLNICDEVCVVQEGLKFDPSLWCIRGEGTGVNVQIIEESL